MAYHFVVLNDSEDLFTSTLCFQILHFIQNDNSTYGLMKGVTVIIELFH